MNGLILFLLCVFQVGLLTTLNGDLTVTNGSGSGGGASEEGHKILFDGVKPVSSGLGLLVVFTFALLVVSLSAKEVLESFWKVAGS